jgi:hypothetical protein
MLLFDDAAVEVVFFAAQMPHGWDSSVAIRPHVHWCKTTSAAGDVAWGLKWRSASIGQTFSDQAADYVLSSPSVADEDTADHHALSSFEFPVIIGRPSHMFLFELARVADDESDTYAADAKFLEFDLHYLAGAAGTINEFSD